MQTRVVLESQDLLYANINKIIGERGVAKLCCLCLYKTGTFSQGVSGVLITKEGKERKYFFGM